MGYFMLFYAQELKFEEMLYTKNINYVFFVYQLIDPSGRLDNQGVIANQRVHFKKKKS